MNWTNSQLYKYTVKVLKSLKIPFNDPCDPSYEGDCSVCNSSNQLSSNVKYLVDEQSNIDISKPATPPNSDIPSTLIDGYTIRYDRADGFERHVYQNGSWSVFIKPDNSQPTININ